MQQPGALFRPRLAMRKKMGSVIYVLFLLATMVGIVGLVVLLAQVIAEGAPWLNWNFLNSYPSRHPEEAGIKSALWGSVWLMGLTAAFAIPIGVGAAIYLEEYAAQNRLTAFIEVNLSNLAGVPSIVYGLLGLTLFVQWMFSGERVLLAGAMTMALLVMPIVILASREAIRAVPDTYRQAGYALGAEKWQVVKGIVLPQALPGILTGTILAMSRALGEAAPVIAISALVYLTFVPVHPLEQFTVLPIQIFNWTSRPQDEFRGIAAAGIVVLLVVLLTMNAVAIILRDRHQVRSSDG